MHRVSGRTSRGNAVSTVVEGEAGALAKAHEYLDDGFEDIRVGRLDGKDMPLAEFERFVAGGSGENPSQ